MKKSGITLGLSMNFERKLIEYTTMDFRKQKTLAGIIWHRFKIDYPLSGVKWEDFVNSMDIGVECKMVERTHWSYKHWSYKITNKKKWNYARIKYEF
jgi:hypothetical protein